MTRSPWLSLALVSALFFVITAATFDVLGLVLPAMVADLHWSWAEAGTGFTLLGLFCGITATIPASLIRRFGVRVNLLLGAGVMALAFVLLARTTGLLSYFIGASLVGLGFTLLDSVPGTWLLSRLFPRPSFAIGLYFTIGALGGAAGPLFYLAVIHLTHDWRSFWLATGAVVAVTAVVAALLVDSKTDAGGADGGDEAISTERWSLREALATPQFWIIAAAYSAFLFCGFTANSVSVPHLAQHGVGAALAGGMMSVEGVLNAAARLAGGVLAKYVKPKLLLLAALLALIVGLLALSAADSLPLLLLYAAGIGIGFGLTLFAATILLLDYFGRGPYLELFAVVNLISTSAAVSPLLAGLSRDHTGSFVPFFLLLAVLVGLVMLAVALMRPPRKAAA